MVLWNFEKNVGGKPVYCLSVTRMLTRKIKARVGRATTRPLADALEHFVVAQALYIHVYIVETRVINILR
jgi:hypothetical protein